MTTATSDMFDYSLAEFDESRRPVRTILLYILLGWMTETFFLFFGMVMFPQLHPPLLPRLYWTQILCGIGMGASAGAIGYLAGHRYKLGSRGALVWTAIGAGAVFLACNNVCFFVDTKPGVDYWGTHENPLLFIVKGDTGGPLLGIIGGFLLNTKRGVKILNKIPFLR